MGVLGSDWLFSFCSRVMLLVLFSSFLLLVECLLRTHSLVFFDPESIPCYCPLSREEISDKNGKSQ